MNYFQRIPDKHTDDALRRVVDELNQIRQANNGTTAQVAALEASRPTIQQVQQQLQVGGQAPLNISGLPGVLSTPQIAASIGTHAQRVATTPKLGVFFEETDRKTLYVGETSGTTPIWVYVSGVMFDSFANRPTDLGVNDAGFLYIPSEHLHWCRWSGSAWVILDPDAGTFVDSAVALGTGYQLCDGTATTYLAVSGATLVETAFTTPDETSGASGVYHKSAASYTGTINAAVAPGATSGALTFTGTPGTTGNDGDAGVQVIVAAGTLVSTNPHTHPFTPAGTINTPTITVDGTAQPRNLGVLRYFRR